MSHRLSPDLMRILRERFGVRELRPGQADVLASVLRGDDTVAVMPTGSGKSLCFQLPALLQDGLTVVVSPLIALMHDQADKLGNIDLPPAVVNSAVGDGALASLARGGERILLTTPEQLEDEAVMAALRRNRVALFVVDEAHCISQWGHDFRPAYLGLRDAIAALSRPPVLALTATATEAVVKDIAAQLGMRRPRVIRTPLYRPNLVYAVEHVSGEAARLDAVMRLVSAQAGAGIVYTATVALAEQLAARLQDALRDAGRRVALYHGRRTASQRREAQDAFMTGQADVMVATNAFGMGIDKPDVRFIVHAQCPGSLDAYYQESGRAGRDGETAHCTLVFDEKDRRIHQFFLANRYPALMDLRQMADAVRPAPRAVAALQQVLPHIGMRRIQAGMRMLADFGIVRRDRRGRFALRDGGAGDVEAIAARYEARSREDRETLQAMLGYARSGRCRWTLLLAYYGEGEGLERCGTCDSCRGVAAVTAAQATMQRAVAGRVERNRAGGTDDAGGGAAITACVTKATAGDAMEAAESVPGTGEAGTAAQEGAEAGVRPASARFAEGDAVRARRFGPGTVVAVTTEWVEVRFPDESVRRFLPEYLRRPAGSARSTGSTGSSRSTPSTRPARRSRQARTQPRTQPRTQQA